MQSKICVVLTCMLIGAVVVNARDCGPISVTGDNVDQYQDCTQASSLTIGRNDLIVSAAFPALTMITGSLSIYSCSALQTLAFPQLLAVLNYLEINNNYALVEVDLSGLQFAQAMNIGGNLLYRLYLDSMRNAGSLTLQNIYIPSVNMPYLSSTTGTIVFQDCPSLSMVMLGSLSDTLGVEISGTPNLWRLELPALHYIGNRFLLEDTRLESANVPLISVTNGVTISNNFRMTSIALTQLTSIGTTLSIQSNQQLSTVNLCALSSVSTQFDLQSISTLISCQQTLRTSFNAQCLPCPTTAAATNQNHVTEKKNIESAVPLSLLRLRARLNQH